MKTTSSSLIMKLSTVTGWASLYCYIFALTYRDKLSRSQFLTYLCPAGGFFLVSLLSAGRQAAFQLLLVPVIIYFASAPKDEKRRTSSSKRALGTQSAETPLTRPVKTANNVRGGLPFAGGVAIVLLFYMGYVAIARNDGGISADRSVALRYLFNYEVSPYLESFEKLLGTWVKQFIEETFAYFSAPLPLFRSFLSIQQPEPYFGLFSFPFAFRQIEPLANNSVIGALYYKVYAMGESGVIGAGWTTAFSAYMWDFGRLGACVFLFVQGFYSERIWFNARNRGRFNDFVLFVLVMLSAIYTPIAPASSDTGMFLLWTVCTIAGALRTFHERGTTTCYRKARFALPGARGIYKQTASIL